MSQLYHPFYIMVIDQNRLFREKIAFLLSQDHNNHYAVKADFENIESGIQFLQHTPVDLLLVEAALLEDHVALTRLKDALLRYPELKIILLTSHNQLFLQAPMKWLEIDHMLTKRIDTEELLQFIENVLTHHCEAGAGTTSYLKDLTPRESEILEWLVKGDSNKEIARELQISESTVKVHVQNILKKFKVSSRVEAAVYAVRNELSA